MSKEVFFAGEDDLTRVLCRKLLVSLIPDGNFVDISAKQGGAAGHRERFIGLKGWTSPSNLLFLVDQDNYSCPPSLLSDWLKKARIKILPPSMTFCVITRECESWLLGDRQTLADFLGVKIGKISSKPEELSDQKSHLLAVSAMSKKFKADICPTLGSLARVGPSYNDVLGRYVEAEWRPSVAAEACPTLKRAIERLTALE